MDHQCQGQSNGLQGDRYAPVFNVPSINSRASNYIAGGLHTFNYRYSCSRFVKGLQYYLRRKCPSYFKLMIVRGCISAIIYLTKLQAQIRIRMKMNTSTKCPLFMVSYVQSSEWIGQMQLNDFTAYQLIGQKVNNYIKTRIYGVFQSIST